MKKSIVAVLVALSLPVGAAWAQDQGSSKAARGEKFSERFDQADTNGDGKLTLEEAQAKMPMVAKHFDEIDVDKKGYVTKAEVAKAMRKMMAERKAQKSEQSGN